MATKAKTPAATSTAVAVKKTSSANLVSLKDAMAAQLAALSNRVAPASGSAIRVTQDKHFVLPDGTKTPGPLDLVIVDFASKNMFYENAYDPKKIVPPTCFALGSNPLKMEPSANAPEPQSPNCASCMNSKFGPNNEAPECKGIRTLAVLPPDADADTPMWVLNTSPTATKGFDGFVTSVARVFQTPPFGVVVSVSFDPSVTYAKLVFTNPQPNPNLAEHFARQAEATAMLEVEPDVSQYVKAPPPAPRGKAAAGRR